MSIPYITSLASSGCSIVVVYAVWDRVVRVRFPAPRQKINKKHLLKAGVFCATDFFVGEPGIERRAI